MAGHKNKQSREGRARKVSTRNDIKDNMNKCQGWVEGGCWKDVEAKNGN